MELNLTSLIQRDINTIRNQRFQKIYNWEVLMPTFFPIIGEMVSQLIQNVRYSDFAIVEPDTVRNGAYVANYVNDLQSPKLNIEFLENEFGFVKLYLSSWKNAMLDRSGLWKKKIGGYAKDIVLLYYTNTGLPLREVRFHNAFPLKFYETELDYNRNEIVRVSIPFACDVVLEGPIGTTGAMAPTDRAAGALLQGDPSSIVPMNAAGAGSGSNAGFPIVNSSGSFFDIIEEIAASGVERARDFPVMGILETVGRIVGALGSLAGELSVPEVPMENPVDVGAGRKLPVVPIEQPAFVETPGVGVGEVMPPTWSIGMM